MEQKVFNVNDLRSRIETSKFYGELQWGDKVKLMFEVKDPHSYCDIPTHEFSKTFYEVEGNCVCTKDEVYIRDGFIEVTFDTSKVPKPTGRQPYETSLSILWDDGLPAKKVNDMGQMVNNDMKAKTFLYIYGSILPKP